MKIPRPLPLAILWISSLGLTILATRSWLKPASLEEAARSGFSKDNGAHPDQLRQSPADSPDAPSAAKNALLEPDALARVAGIAGMLPSMSERNALEVLDTYRRIKKEKGSGLDMEGELILLQVGRTAGLAALARDRPRDPASPNIPAQSGLLIRGFAGNDSTGALNYWRSLPDGPYKNSLKSGLLTGLAENNTALARDFFTSLPPTEQVSRIPDLTRQIMRQEGAKALQDWFDGVADHPTDPTVKWTSFHAVARELQQSPAANADYMTREASKPYAASDIYNQYAIAWTDSQPAAALDWAARLPAPEGTTLRAEAVNTVISRWTADDAGGVGDWLNANDKSPHYDEIAAGYAQQLSIIDPTAAFKWTNTIRNPELRATMTDRLGGIVATVQ